MIIGKEHIGIKLRRSNWGKGDWFIPLDFSDLFNVKGILAYVKESK